ncbi:hypothetical protein [Corynebacterium singulare]|uniref:Uncharacterized protein n=1 Tax=Corynebacterium singulare TaxID=161899 RepID=A0A0B6ERZ6_9CORY|nr:hypothetical protein [Corynebacterium singulare]AJI79302.1 hypothetical protein CSING_08915 [Corynebacterium singulare]
MTSRRVPSERIYWRRRIAALVLLAVAACAVVLAFGVFGTQPSTALQGDQLGPDGAESAAEYRERAEESLAQADEPTYALVGFNDALTPKETADLLSPVQRMNAIVIGLAAPVVVPEPTAGKDRSDVIDTVLHRVADRARDIGEDAPTTVDAAVVYSSGAELRALAADPRVATVEAAPADAPWGSFGVRPPSNVHQTAKP